MSFNSHVHVIKNDGTLWGWGAGTFHGLGYGSTTNLLVPTRIGTSNDWNIIASGDSFSVGIKKDGTMWSCGFNTDGRTGQGTTSGYTTVFTQIGSDNDWKYVACGINHTLAIKEDGRLYVFGDNSYGKLGLGTGSGTISTPTLVGIDKDWKFVACGSNHNLAIKEDGTLWGVGLGTSGQMGASITTVYVLTKLSIDTNWKYVSASAAESIALKDDNTLWVTGGNLYGQLGLGHTTKVTEWTKVPSNQPWKSISTGNFSIYAIKEDGTLWAAGRALNFANGQEDALDTSVFKQVGYETYWENLKGGVSYCVVISSSKFAFTFGAAGNGRLGNGTASPNQFILQATGLKDIEAIPESLRLRRFPILQPATIIADCQAQAGLKRIVVAGKFPALTHVRFLISADQVVWKSYNQVAGAWEEVALADSSTKGMTKEVFESLREAQLIDFNGVAFKVAITVWTESRYTTPTIRGLDAFVATGVQTASIQSLGVNYSLLKSETPKYYVSRNDGLDWQEIELDALVKLDTLPEGKKLRVKAVLSNGQELHGLSYSWI